MVGFQCFYYHVFTTVLLLDIFHPFCYWESILLIKYLICWFSKIKCHLLLTHLLQTISGLASPSCSGVQILAKPLKMPWSRLRCWNHRRQKIVKVRPWIWKSNIFSHLYLLARVFLFTSYLNVWEREKQILANGIIIPKNPKTRVDILWIFTDFHRVLRVQIAPPEFKQCHLAADREIVY